MGKLYQVSKLAVITAGLLLTPYSQAAERTHQITTDDFFDIGGMQSVQLSPDGKLAIWLESRWDKELDKSQKDLWQVNTKNRKATRLTFTNESESSPQWSPNGEFIYYLGKVTQEGKKAPFNGKNQVFRIAKSGGDAVPITKEVEGVSAYSISSDGNSLYFLANKTVKDKDLWASMRASHSQPKYGHGERKTNPLYKLDLNHFKQQLILDDDKVVWQFSVSDDGSQIARITTSDNELVNLEGWSDIEISDAPSHGRGKPWLHVEDQRLVDRFLAGDSVESLVMHHGRSPRALVLRLERNGVISDDHPFMVEAPAPRGR